MATLGPRLLGRVAEQYRASDHRRDLVAAGGPSARAKCRWLWTHGRFVRGYSGHLSSVSRRGLLQVLRHQPGYRQIGPNG